MAVKLSEHAPERGTFHVVCTFEDEDDAGAVPTSVTWTLMDPDGVVVNGRQDVVATPATSVTITTAGTDLALISGKTNDRIFLVEWVYDSSYGTGLEASEEAIFTIDPRKGV